MSQDEEAELRHFKTISWCAKILDDPDFVYARTTSRHIKPTTEDAFFAETLKTEHTIPACISLYRRPCAPLARIEEVRTLLQLGYRLNGYPHIAHGGVQSFIVDEIMALLLSFNKDLEGGPIRQAMVTASLRISFLKPVKTPSVVLVTAKFRHIQGRKHFIDAEILDEKGVPLVRADALFIALGGSKAEKL